MRLIDTLKPCPFCGGPGLWATTEDERNAQIDDIYYVKCGDCGAHGSRRDTPFDAGQWWNGEHLKRAIQDRLRDYPKWPYSPRPSRARRKDGGRCWERIGLD